MKYMANILFFVFFFLLKLLGQGGYFKLTETTNAWIIKYVNYSYNTGFLLKYYFTNDTMVNNKIYRKLKPGNLLVREDTINKKVYAILPNQEIFSDKLIFDFNANTGDTIKSLWAYMYNPQYPNKEYFIPANYPSIALYGMCKYNFVVTAVDSVLICNKYRRRIHSQYSRWIEGIGYEYGFMHCGGELYCYSFYNGSSFVSFANNVCFNNFYCSQIQINHNHNLINPYIKISYENQQITVKSNDYISDVYIYDLYGKKIHDTHQLNKYEHEILLNNKNEMLVIFIVLMNGKTLKKLIRHVQ